jgi:hypothetical protein
MPKPQYNVRAVYDVRADGPLYGPFADREEAEQCVIVLAGRVDVISATIEPIGETDG